MSQEALNESMEKRKRLNSKIRELMYMDVDEIEYAYDELVPHEDIPFCNVRRFYDANDRVRKEEYINIIDTLNGVEIFDEEGRSVFTANHQSSARECNVIFVNQSFRIYTPLNTWQKKSRVFKLSLVDYTYTVNENNQ